MSLVQTFNHFLLPLNRIFYLGQTNSEKNSYRPEKDTVFNIRSNSTDKYTVWGIYKGKSYHDKTHPIKETDTIIDIGANIGAFSLWAGKLAGRGNVYSYEPDSDNYDLLKKNISDNNRQNIIPKKLAVSDTSEDLVLYTQPSTNGVNHSMCPDKYAQKVIVPSTTLADIIRDNHLKKINLLKLDAEGAEYPIILNSPDSVFSVIDGIILEYHDYLDPSFQVKKLINRLTALGYQVEKTHEFGNIKSRLINSGILKAYRP